MFTMNIFLDLLNKYEQRNKVNSLYSNDLKWLISKSLKNSINRDFCDNYFLKGLKGVKDYYMILTEDDTILGIDILLIEEPNIIVIAGLEIKETIEFEEIPSTQDVKDYFVKDQSNEQISKGKS